jgi:hypothetical protein
MKIRLLTGAILSLLLCSGIVCWAEDLTPVNEQATQSAEIEKSGAIFKVQKQPSNGNTSQNIKVSKCGLCVLVQINGKVKEEK